MRVSDVDAAVAVVGLAFELPSCPGWDELTRILRSGTSCLGPMPAHRAESTGVTRSAQDRQAGWLDHVAGFDHRYFGLSRAEAELIDPRQRRMLHLAVQAIGRAGYPPKELRGGNVATLVAAFGGPHPTLYDLLPPVDQANGLAFTGSMHAYAAGRIAYHLDLCGPALVVDTSCSSFLVALHEARWKLARGEVDLALVGGHQIHLGAPPRRTTTGEGLGVLSSTDRCRPFDAAADGTAMGEGGGFVLVKRLADALCDGDTVHAVIRGSAVNQDAGRRNGLAAPSPVAQAEVIVRAWRDANLDPATIGYLEAHGTATRIGDPIEIQGLSRALGHWPDRDSQLPISSVKGNFGHLGAMAGFAGLVRVIAQFRAGEIFPTAHFTAPNPLLQLAGVPLRIAAQCEPWAATAGPRRAVLSGFGLSGTNAHLVVEQGPPAGGPPAQPGERVVVLSARDVAGLRELRTQLRDTVASGVSGFDLASAADVLALGREHFAARSAWAVRDARELLEKLDDGSTGIVEQQPSPLVFAFGDATAVEVMELTSSAAAYPAFGRVVAQARGHLPVGSWSPAQRCLVWLAGVHAALRDFGVGPDLVLAHGAGTMAARVVNGAMDLGAALDGLTGDQTPPPPQRERVRAALAGLAAGATVFDLAPGGALSTQLSRLDDGAPAPRIEPVRSVAQALRLLHLQGHSLDWRAGLGRGPGRRVELPVAPLAEVACWPSALSDGEHTARPAEATLTAGAEATPTEGSEVSPTPRATEDVILDLVRSVLKEPDAQLADDFFDLGGNSLNGSQLVARINERYGTDLEAMDLFDAADIAALVETVERVRPSPGRGPAAAAAGAAAGRVPASQPSLPRSAPLSGQQQAIWSAIELASESGAYNLPGAFLLDAEPDIDRLTAQMADLLSRHEMLRCSLRDGPDGPVQVVHPPEAVPVAFDRRTVDLSATTAAAGRPDLIAWLDELVAEPMPLYDQPPVRFHLVRAQFADRQQHVVVFTAHHLFFDGWSWRIVLRELEEGVVDRPAPARRYFDHVAEQRAMLEGEDGRRLTRFWAQYLGGSRPVPLPTDGAALTSSTLSMAGAHVLLPIEPAFADRLRRFAGAEHVTLNMVLQAAWMAQLWKVSGARDISVGMPVAGRRPDDEAVVGNYVNVVVVRVRLRPEEPFRALLGAVREASMTAYAHRDLPSNHILRAAGLTGSAPLATSVLNFQSGFTPLRRLGPHGPAELLDVDPAGAKFPLNLAILEYGTQLQARLKYANELFHRQTVRAWLDEYDDLLHRVVDVDGKEDLFTLFRSTGRGTDAPNPPQFRF